MLLVIQGYCDVNLVKRYPVVFMIQPSTCTNDTVWATEGNDNYVLGAGNNYLRIINDE